MHGLHHALVLGLQGRDVAGKCSGRNSVGVFQPDCNNLVRGYMVLGQVIVEDHAPVVGRLAGKQLRGGPSLRSVNDYQIRILRRIGIRNGQETIELVLRRGLSDCQQNVLPTRARITIGIERLNAVGKRNSVGIMTGGAHVASVWIQTGLGSLIRSGAEIGKRADRSRRAGNIE